MIKSLRDKKRKKSFFRRQKVRGEADKKRNQIMTGNRKEMIKEARRSETGM